MLAVGDVTAELVNGVDELILLIVQLLHPGAIVVALGAEFGHCLIRQDLFERPFFDVDGWISGEG